MKASQFADAQKAFIIKQGEQGTPARLCRHDLACAQERRP
jgi:hypothetical protein